MIIEFKSFFKAHGEEEPNIIQFKSELIKEFENGFNILTFSEKRENKLITNRVEYNENELKIFSGVSSLTCQLNKVVKNNFVVEGVNETFFLYTKLNEIKIDGNSLEFKYLISHTEDLAQPTNIHLQLTIFEEDATNLN